MEFGTHAWQFKSLDELTSDELVAAKEEVTLQRKAIVTSVQQPALETTEAFHKEWLGEEGRLTAISERAREISVSAEQQAKSMNDFNTYMQGRAEETRAWAKSVTENPAVAVITAPAKVLSGVGDSLGDVGAGISDAVGGVGEGLGGALGGIQTGLAGIGIFVMLAVVGIIIFMVMGKGF